MKFSLHPYYEAADYKSDIRFQTFCAQTPKFRHFVSKNINFLILTKFCLYPVSKVLISKFIFKNPQILAFCAKKNFLILTKLHLPLFDVSDFIHTFEQKS